jgi:hypothetical protein
MMQDASFGPVFVVAAHPNPSLCHPYPARRPPLLLLLLLLLLSLSWMLLVLLINVDATLMDD